LFLSLPAVTATLTGNAPAQQRKPVRFRPAEVSPAGREQGFAAIPRAHLRTVSGASFAGAAGSAAEYTRTAQMVWHSVHAAVIGERRQRERLPDP
jgi:hypothetical protein